MAATMIEMDDGAQLRTWTAGSVIPQGLPVVMVHGGPGIRDYLAPVAGLVELAGEPGREAGGVGEAIAVGHLHEGQESL
jgi:hypothetical protein